MAEDQLNINLDNGDSNEHDYIECIDVLTEGTVDSNNINEHEYITILKHNIYTKVYVKKHKNVPTIPDRVTDTCEPVEEKNIKNNVKSIEESEIEISTINYKTKANERPRIRNIEQFAKSKNI